MEKFVDETFITIKAGNGGAGCISFQHLKYKEYAGPDGGDGGRGGDIFMQASHKVLSLAQLHRKKNFKAESGQTGQGRLKSGRKGKDEIIKVPIGSQLINEDENIVHDFKDEEPFLLSKGARGGKGNAFFTTSTNQAPRKCQPGENTEAQSYKITLKLIADAGFVGFPNAGKSTLLKALTEANPKIGNYPFTTLSPNLGVLAHENHTHYLLADIPGILEGASKGHGLGLSFLKHIERVKLLIFVLDLMQSQPQRDLEILWSELRQYNEALLKRPYLVIFNKSDLVEDKDFLNEWIDSFKGENINPIVISASNHEGIDLVAKAICESLSKIDE